MQERQAKPAIARLVRLALLAVALAAPTTAAAEREPRFFTMHADVVGHFIANYGDDRHSGFDSRGFGTDGTEMITWTWELKSVGELFRKPARVESTAAIFRRGIDATSDTLEYDHNGGPSGGELQERPICKPTTPLRYRTFDGRQSSEEADFGAWVRHRHLDLTIIPGATTTASHVEVPTAPRVDCLLHRDAHGLNFWTSGFFDVPRGGFSPGSDPSYHENFFASRMLMDDEIPPSAHYVSAEGRLELSIEKISSKRARKLTKNYGVESKYAEEPLAP